MPFHCLHRVRLKDDGYLWGWQVAAKRHRVGVGTATQNAQFRVDVKIHAFRAWRREKKRQG